MSWRSFWAHSKVPPLETDKLETLCQWAELWNINSKLTSPISILAMRSIALNEVKKEFVRNFNFLLELLSYSRIFSFYNCILLLHPVHHHIYLVLAHVQSCPTIDGSYAPTICFITFVSLPLNKVIIAKSETHSWYQFTCLPVYHSARENTDGYYRNRTSVPFYS